MEKSEGMMSADLNDDEILEIAKIIDESDFDELDLETENLKLVLRKRGDVRPAQELQHLNLQQHPPDVPKAAPAKRQITAAPAPLEEGLVAVKSPVLGIFYRSVRPGAPHFVEEGAPVKENDTVCIIEVMKVFNTVAAGVRGVVARICAENGQTVELGQTLFLIRPDGEHERQFEA